MTTLLTSSLNNASDSTPYMANLDLDVVCAEQRCSPTLLSVLSHMHVVQLSQHAELKQLMLAPRTGERRSVCKLPLRKALSASEFSQILGCKRSKNCCRGTHSRFILTCAVLYFTGMRVNESGILTRKDLEFLIKNLYLQVYRQKTHDTHMYHISSSGARVLSSLTSHIDEVFHDSTTLRGSTTPRVFSRFVNRYLAKYVLSFPEEPVKSHSFRIGRVTTLLRDGSLPIHEVSKLIGHKNIETTIKYFRYSVSPAIQEQIDQSDTPLLKLWRTDGRYHRV